jgi:hypothetical protein
MSIVRDIHAGMQALTDTIVITCSTAASQILATTANRSRAATQHLARRRRGHHRPRSSTA